MSYLLAVDLLPSFLPDHGVARVFTSFHGLLRIQLLVNAHGGSVGSAVLEVSNPDDAQRIIQAMDGVKMADTTTRVSRLDGLPQEPCLGNENALLEHRQCNLGAGWPYTNIRAIPPAPRWSVPSGIPPNVEAQYPASGVSASQDDHLPMATEADKPGRVIGEEGMGQLCAHQRVIDELRDAQGHPTGKLVCLECGAVWPDPDNHNRQPRSA